jgi:UDP-N-acetyl-D-mannosaminuronate dehydrogenase
MPNAIHLKLEDLDTVEKRGKYTICIIGCGQTGVNYSLAFLEAGFKVVCSDSDQSVVRRLSRGRFLIEQRRLGLNGS